MDLKEKCWMQAWTKYLCENYVSLPFFLMCLNQSAGTTGLDCLGRNSHLLINSRKAIYTTSWSIWLSLTLVQNKGHSPSPLCSDKFRFLYNNCTDFLYFCFVVPSMPCLFTYINCPQPIKNRWTASFLFSVCEFVVGWCWVEAWHPAKLLAHLTP